MNENIEHELDACGLSCPQPILKTKTALKSMSGGQILRVLATDPGSTADMKSFCRTTGNEMVSISQNQDTFEFLIRKREAVAG